MRYAIHSIYFQGSTLSSLCPRKDGANGFWVTGYSRGITELYITKYITLRSLNLAFTIFFLVTRRLELEP